MSVDFNQAIEIAKENARILLPKASSFDLEGIILNNNEYEVTLSYMIDYSDKIKDGSQDSGVGFIMATLARKEKKKFLSLASMENLKVSGILNNNVIP